MIALLLNGSNKNNETNRQSRVAERSFSSIAERHCNDKGQHRKIDFRRTTTVAYVCVYLYAELSVRAAPLAPLCTLALCPCAC
jgi:hypothetical protein